MTAVGSYSEQHPNEPRPTDDVLDSRQVWINRVVGAGSANAIRRTAIDVICDLGNFPVQIELAGDVQRITTVSGLARLLTEQLLLELGEVEVHPWVASE